VLARGTPIWLSAIPFLSLLSAGLFLVMESTYFLLLSLVIICGFVPLLLFFRDPERSIAPGVVCPADGKVMEVDRVGGWITVKIFMNVHNVHVNRWPADGKVLSVKHIPGKFVPAFDKDSDRNERVVISFRTDNGTWEVKQIAGAVARRIVTYVGEGDEFVKGERFGLIRFGSRVDLKFKLPRGHIVAIKKGQKVLAGSTSLTR
jgi:phosphatidylserine decarboxylase